MEDPKGPAAGWYRDPSGAPRQRYWDGDRWTDHFVDAAMPQAVAPGSAGDLKDLRDGARRAKIAVVVGVPFNAVTPALQGQQIREARRAIAEVREQLDELQDQPTPGVQVRPFTPSPVSSVGPALSLPSLVIGVIFLIWFHKAVTVAVQLRRPARRTPGWAVGGWFIPIGNFFLPFQSARDIFRAREPGQSTVKRWWAAYLTALLINFPLAVVAGFDGRVEVAVAAGALSLVAWLYAALKAHEFIDAATRSLASAS